MSENQWNQGYYDGRTDAELGHESQVNHPSVTCRADYQDGYERGYRVGKETVAIRGGMAKRDRDPE